MLTYSVQQQGQEACIRFTGPVDEDAVRILGDLLLQTIAKSIVLDMGGIEYFNSLGIRAWVNFVKSLRDGRRLSYQRCTPDFINQVAMIPALSQEIPILSFSSDFFCLACDHRQSVEFDGLQAKALLLKAFHSQTCSQCGATLLPDEDPATLVLFKGDA